MSGQNSLRILFGSFAALVALRDIFQESSYREDSATFAFLIFFVVSAISAGILAYQGQLSSA